MTLFFDRDTGTALPMALRLLRFGTSVHYHQEHFAMDCADDEWMPVVGEWGWTILGHDGKHHLRPNELSAIKQYNLGCFYLWGANAKRWEKMCCFAKAHRRIALAEACTPRPFVYRVGKTGALSLIPLP